MALWFVGGALLMSNTLDTGDKTTSVISNSFQDSNVQKVYPTLLNSESGSSTKEIFHYNNGRRNHRY